MAKKFRAKQFNRFNGLIIHCWERPNGDVILLSTSHYRGNECTDLRAWFLSDDGLFHPTRSGISFRSEELKYLIAAVDKLKELKQ